MVESSSSAYRGQSLQGRLPPSGTSCPRPRSWELPTPPDPPSQSLLLTASRHVCPAGALPQLMPQRGHPSQVGLRALPGLLMAHEPQPEADGLLDLSFLTDEEQEAIADVLKRDAHLRQLEEGRVR
ncbi:synaptotagmin-like protein 1 [Leptonychotes weddellii]|uniref:Synaptotagmin-like protein 1 n=1 Tax=Leptonychotes weddellii TaxID=9713 RepID=A0A7F8RD62_LEPWE|nr:synaptotagmin-like protein 1 [Leptonychotes weddellii]